MFTADAFVYASSSKIIPMDTTIRFGPDKGKLLGPPHPKHQRCRSFPQAALNKKNVNCLSDVNSIAVSLRRCSDRRSLLEGKHIHRRIVEIGLEGDRFLGNLLVQMYGKCKAVDNARAVFDSINNRNVVTWNLMIGVCVSNQQFEEAMELFSIMPERNVISWTLMITSFAQQGNVKEALRHFLEMPDKNIVSWTAMVSAYASQGKLTEAQHIFDQMPQKDVAAWNAMIAANVQHGKLQEAFHLFGKMPNRDMFSWSTLISGYAQKGHLKEALLLFQHMPHPNVVSYTALLSAYVQQGQLSEALHLFQQMPHQDTFSWNVMIAGYAQHGQLKQSFHLFQKMPKPNVISWNTVISGCCQHGELNEAKKLFKIMPVRDVISWNIMLAGYAKAGFVDEALEVLNQMPIRDTVSWNTVIAAHAQQKGPSTALQLLQQMQLADMKPDNFTLACIIDACAGIADLAKGVEVHTYILEHGFRVDTVVCNALVNMYGKCGSLKDAKSVFDKMAQKNTTTWNIMITAYSQHGHGAEAVQLFMSMVSNGVLADRVTFLGVLSACGHVGLADIGFFCFISMRQEYTITAAMDHFTCIIDSLGRAGWLDEAEVFVNSMPFEPDAACWRALLSYCRLYYDVFKGIRAACNAFGIDPENAAAYISLSNIWAVDMALFP